MNTWGVARFREYMAYAAVHHRINRRIQIKMTIRIDIYNVLDPRVDFTVHSVSYTVSKHIDRMKKNK